MREPPAIEAYGGGGFRIAGRRCEGSVLILDDEVRPFRPRRLEETTAEDFAPAISRPEVSEFVLLGTGARLAPAPKAVREALQEVGIGLEVMSTGEACRLYNLLAAEGRRIAAALILVD